jgi:hypothetical protein
MQMKIQGDMLQIRQQNDSKMRRVTQARRMVAAKRQRLQEQWARVEEAQKPNGALAQALELAKMLRNEFPTLSHSWRAVLGGLITRRHQLVVSVSSLYRLGPKVSFQTFSSVCMCHYIE